MKEPVSDRKTELFHCRVCVCLGQERLALSKPAVFSLDGIL